ncbi:unnamed protein product [Chondrus crispus]|uniref:Uncharacterized protein n=1 Tax=Chondrus crispus TaxID=2769 RepID=R7QNY2_CHOCR|nr:unnamed protein product [Chondrus crispus]CDF39809.1 unnamed protein product [Chondrus crispus]|eukprot:XP_005710103.1 unnamed protein product [Chondrus crispus]
MRSKARCRLAASAPTPSRFASACDWLAICTRTRGHRIGFVIPVIPKRGAVTIGSHPVSPHLFIDVFFICMYTTVHIHPKRNIG